MRSVKTLVILMLFLASDAMAVTRLLGVSASNEQEVLRLELQFDNVVEVAFVNLDFAEKNISLRLPDAEIRRNFTAPVVSAPFLKDVKFLVSRDKTLLVDLELADVSGLQMKENLTMESMGKTLIIEVLPPIWNKPLAGEKKEGGANSVSSTVAGASTEITTLDAKNRSEREIPLFEKKKDRSQDDSSSTRIILTIAALVGLGGYFLWWMKNRTKMVNGPESLMKIKVLTQFHLGPKKSLAVVRVAGESLLLAITDSQISLIKTLSLLDEELPEIPAQDFGQALTAQTGGDIPRLKISEVEAEASNDEEFSFGPAVKTTLTQKIPMLRKML
jgi:flagellar protein FliO/FliZ